jgi:hypothetical protein
MLILLLVAGTLGLVAAPAGGHELCTPRTAVDSAIPPSDDDWDCDSVADTEDNCPPLGYDDLRTRNPNQQNTDAGVEGGDEDGDWCDADDDADGIPDWRDGQVDYASAFPRRPWDNCRLIPNPDQEDANENGIGDACEMTTEDGDKDGVLDIHDNCVEAENPDQADFDRDGAGDVCDNDDDGDNVRDTSDNCLRVTNPRVEPAFVQPDADGDGVGDACEPPALPALGSTSGITAGEPAVTAADARDPAVTIVDRQAPRVTLSLKTALRAAEAEDGLVVRLRCSEACFAAADLRVDRKLARRLKLRGTMVVARGTARVEAAATTYVFVRFNQHAQAKLWRLRRASLTLRVAVTDPSGNVRRVSERVRFRR